MSGSIREKRPGYWEVRVSLGRDPVTGVAQYASRAMRGMKREAQKALTALAHAVDEQGVAAAPGTVGSLIEDWLQHIEREGRSPSTMAGYRSLQGQLPDAFLRKRLVSVTPKLLELLYVELGRKEGRGASTVQHFHRLLRAAFNQGMRWGMVAKNPTTLVTPPRAAKYEITPPAISEVRRVLEAARTSRNAENALIFRFMAATGCRRGEACGVRWEDLDLERGLVVLRSSVVQVKQKIAVKDTKTHQRRTVSLDANTVATLDRHFETSVALAQQFESMLKPASFVFSDVPGGGTPVPPTRLTQAWDRLATACGVDARLHDLRHFQASALIDAGESIATVAARLGHGDTSTTLRVYAHLMPGADGRAAGIVGSMLDGDAGVTEAGEQLRKSRSRGRA